MRWDVRPRDGVGPLAFGMTPDEVATAVGSAPTFSRQSPVRRNTVMQAWPVGGQPWMLPKVFFVDARLDEVEFYGDVGEVWLGPLNLLGEPAAVIAALSETERTARGRIFVGDGAAHFTALGVVVSDPDIPPEERTVLCVAGDRTEFYRGLSELSEITDTP